jgi:hypothetical protein
MNNSQPRGGSSTEANHGKLPPWQHKQAVDPAGLPRVNFDLMLSQPIYSLQYAQIQVFPEPTWSLIQSMPTSYQPPKSDLTGTRTSTDNHSIDMHSHDQFDSSFYLNHSANGRFLAPATCQTSEIPPLVGLPEWTPLSKYCLGSTVPNLTVFRSISGIRWQKDVVHVSRHGYLT